MEYGKVIAVTGLPGLFELLSSKNDGAIVRSLEDKSTKFVSSRVHNFSHLESIEVFTVRENVNLVDIFHAMEGSGKATPDGKDGAALKKYFEEVYPDLDFERVYTSDLKKMAKWFTILKENEVEIKLTRSEENETDTTEPVEEVEAVEVEETEEKPAAEAKPKKAAKKKAAPKSKDDAPEKEAKTVKKAAKKKKDS
jgi:hypothetical protein